MFVSGFLILSTQNVLGILLPIRSRLLLISQRVLVGISLFNAGGEFDMHM
jgi:hypothetical protein